jgi:hypothetical protein
LAGVPIGAGLVPQAAHTVLFQLLVTGEAAAQHPIELDKIEMIQQRLDCIHNNNVEAGIVLSPEDYLYSSALNYSGLPEKLMEVILI